MAELESRLGDRWESLPTRPPPEVHRVTTAPPVTAVVVEQHAAAVTCQHRGRLQHR